MKSTFHVFVHGTMSSKQHSEHTKPGSVRFYTTVNIGQEPPFLLQNQQHIFSLIRKQKQTHKISTRITRFLIDPCALAKGDMNRYKNRVMVTYACNHMFVRAKYVKLSCKGCPILNRSTCVEQRGYGPIQNRGMNM